MSPPPLSWRWLLVLALVFMIGMLCLAGAESGVLVCSSSESLLLELSSLLEDEELLESEELSPLLSWSMPWTSAINSVHSDMCTNKGTEIRDEKDSSLNKTKQSNAITDHSRITISPGANVTKTFNKMRFECSRVTTVRHRAWHHVTSLYVIHGGCRGCLLFGRGTLGAGWGLVVAAAAAAAAIVTFHLLAQAAGLLLQARMDLTAALSPENAHAQYKICTMFLLKCCTSLKPFSEMFVKWNMNQCMH